MIWRQRDAVDASPSGEAVGLFVLAGASLLWLMMAITNVRVIQQALLPALLVAWALAVLGKSAAMKFLPAAAVFVVALPLWEILVRPLQMAAVASSGVVLRLVQIPAVIDGYVVTINSGSFLIEGACAGLNYLMVGLTLGIVYGQLFLEGWRRRIQLIGLAVITAILSNWIRVTTIIIVGHVTRMESSLITHHGPFGWWVFVAALVVVSPLVRRVEAWDKADRVSPANVDEPSAGLGGESRYGDRRKVRAAVVATMVASVGPVLFFSLGALPTQGAPELTGLGQADEWLLITEETGRPYSWQPDYHGAADHLTASWSNGAERMLLDRFVYRNQIQGAELINWANRIAPDELFVQERLIGPVGAPGRYAWEAVVQSAEGPVLVLYWYRVAGIDTYSRLRAKTLEIAAFFKRIDQSELIAISTQCEPESCVDAANALSRFVQSTLP